MTTYAPGPIQDILVMEDFILEDWPDKQARVLGHLDCLHPVNHIAIMARDQQDRPGGAGDIADAFNDQVGARGGKNIADNIGVQKALPDKTHRDGFMTAAIADQQRHFVG